MNRHIRADAAQLEPLAPGMEPSRALPTEVDAPHQAMLDLLKRASSPAFDKAWLAQQAHQQAPLRHGDNAGPGEQGALWALAKAMPKTPQHAGLLKTLQRGTSGSGH
jgi:hypothetical protein